MVSAALWGLAVLGWNRCPNQLQFILWGHKTSSGTHAQAGF